MSCTLHAHPNQYQLSLSDLAFSLVTGISGIPYAQRHLELARKRRKGYWAHKIIAYIEYVPLLGGIIALIERLVIYFLSYLSTQRELAIQRAKAEQHLRWKPCTSDLSSSLRKMHKNSIKAVKEHSQRNSEKENPYALIEEIPFFSSPPSLLLIGPPPPNLTFIHNRSSSRGLRPYMEDKDFFIETKNGILTGVFDGHAGDKVSNYTRDQVKARFFPLLQRKVGNVKQTFEELLHAIHKEVELFSYKGGSTAVICFIEKKSNFIYTATLGDSEANIYRKGPKKYRSIPLSCVRDWKFPKEAARASICMEIKEGKSNRILTDWPKERYPKKLRYFRINVSRAIGDIGTRVNHNNQAFSAISHKPKITINQLLPGDTLILTSDGLKDFVSEREIVRASTPLFNKKNGQLLSNHLVQYAINKQKQAGYGDNITVLTIEAKI